MKVTHVSLSPSAQAAEAGRPSASPELMASIGAKYSRSNDGLDAILAKIDSSNEQKSIERIFKHTDYGHQSIADMVPVTMFMDGITMYLAYFVWYTCQATVGQESSTRYLPMVDIELTPESPEWAKAVSAASLTVERQNYRASYSTEEYTSESFALYNLARRFWEDYAEYKGGVENLIAMTDEQKANPKTVERLKKNYAFDRARVHLPLTALTNMMMIMSAREWARLICHLVSHPCDEFVRLGEALKKELTLVSPNFVKHGTYKESVARYHASCLEQAHWYDCGSKVPPVDFEVLTANFAGHDAFAERNNRYCSPSVGALDTIVQMRFNSVSIGEMRDINRHRPGMRSCILDAHGFYDPIEEDVFGAREFLHKNQEQYEDLCDVSRHVNGIASDLLCLDDPNYMYFTRFGTTHRYARTCSLAQFVYEVELRTGPGAHYKYAQLYRDMYSQAKLILGSDAFNGVYLGEAEPE